MSRPQGGYKNPAKPNNAGVKRATGEVIILQNPECMHMSENLIERLTNQVTDDSAVFCRALSLKQDGTADQWYCHGDYNARPFFFCGAIKRAWFETLRGFDEDFLHYGYEDDDFAYRLTAAGVRFDFSDLEVWHQWHVPGSGNMSSDLYDAKRKLFLEGKIGIERNLNREWGEL
jgi:GT2 family glycosyltransferase